MRVELYGSDCEQRLKVKNVFMACLCSALCVSILVEENASYLLSLGRCPHALFGQYSSLLTAVFHACVLECVLMSNETEAQ